MIIEEDIAKQFEESFLCREIRKMLAPLQDELTDDAVVRERRVSLNSIGSEDSSQSPVKLFMPLKSYPKLSKFMRILTILMMQINIETANRDQVAVELMALLKTISDFFKWHEPKPFDQINLCIDVMLRQKIPLQEQHHLSD